jgi:DNA-binding MarR family transcriptional regulator
MRASEPTGIRAPRKDAAVRKAKIKKPIRQEPNFEQVGYLCRRVMQASLHDLQATVPDLDVTIGQMGTLVLIACNPGITPTEICRAQGHEKPTITASLDALARKKLITRKPSRSDRRSFSLYLTARGSSFYNEITPRVKASDRRLTQALSSEERAKLIEYLMRIYASECADEHDAGAYMRPAQDQTNGLHPTASPGTLAGRARTSGPRHPARNDVMRHLKEIERSSARLRKAMSGLA